MDKKRVVVIVAHPDDETLWAGGTILSHPSWKWFVVCLCRGSDEERAPKFYKALNVLNAEGIMGDLDDGPEQKPLEENEVEAVVMQLLPPSPFDLIITHSPSGEYTRHIRHEETGQAVTKLWHAGKICARELRTFAYEDGRKAYHPRAIENAPFFRTLPDRIWLRKFNIITKTYGFTSDSWETATTPRAEAFWQISK